LKRLIGCKNDLRTNQDLVKNLQKRKLSPVTSEEGIQMAKEMGAVAYVETSALNHTGVKDVFDIMLEFAVGSIEDKKKDCILQ
jgi:GTPase SAR1 family protein